MAKPTPTLNISKRIGKPIAFSDDDKLAIEAKYGHVLTVEQWEQVTEITSALTVFGGAIQNSTRVAVVLRKLEKLEAVAKSMRSEFNETSDSGDFSPQEIYLAYLARRRGCPPSKEFAFFEELLGAVIKFCEYGRRGTRKPDPKQPNDWCGPSKDEVWNLWVNAIAGIMKGGELPHTVRKDSEKNKNGSPSPFVTLIRELQKRLPQEYRKFTHSDDALSQGISRARHDRQWIAFQLAMRIAPGG